MKKRILTIVAVIALAVVMVVGLVACGGKKEVSGFDIDLAKAIFEKEGIEVVTRKIDWGQKEIELNSGKIDLVWNGMTITDDRKANMQVSIPYLTNEQAVVVKGENASKYSKLADLAGKKVAVEEGSAGADTAKDIKDKKNTNITIKEITAQIDALMEVKSGQSDLAIIDSTMAGYLLNQKDGSYTDLKIVTISDYEQLKEEYGVAARKGNVKLIDFINTKLVELQDTTYSQIAEKYGLSDRKVQMTWKSSLTGDEWKDELKNKKQVVIGYTVNAPMGIELDK